MAWSLGYLPVKEPELLEEFFSAAGKALYLANCFEEKCKWMLRLEKLAHHYEETSDFHASLSLVNALKDRMLGATINELQSFPSLETTDLALLERAKDARNFIAHEGARIGHLSSVSAQRIQEQLVHLRRELAALAAGDNLVSSWLYEVEERRPAPSLIKNAYVGWVQQWVFEEST